MKRRRSEGSDSTSSHILPEQVPLPRSVSSSPEVASGFSADFDTLPLTSENLRQLPGTSPRQAETTRAMSTSSKSKTGPSNQEICHNRRRILEEHLLFINDLEVYAKYPEIQAAVDNVVNIERGSAMKPESAQKLQIWVNQNETEPEKVFFAYVWSKLFKDGRLVKTSAAWVPRDWSEDHFRCSPDMPFYQKVVTGLSFEPAWAKPYEFEKLLDRVKDPKPDLCFGLEKHAFTVEQMQMLHTALPWAEVSTGLYCGFAAVEFKGPDHYITDAEDQAARSGSTLVECSRKIQAKAGLRDLNKPGADSDNIVFTLCMNQANARLFVHWALVKPNGRIEYHMTRLWKGDVLDTDNSIALRRHLNSIVDWGILNRKNRIVAMLPKIAQRAVQGLKTGKDSDKPESSNKAAKTQSESSAGAVTRS